MDSGSGVCVCGGGGVNRKYYTYSLRQEALVCFAEKNRTDAFISIFSQVYMMIPASLSLSRTQTHKLTHTHTHSEGYMVW